jgi:nucleoside-diphosphate-sugar epimerase
MKIGITGTSGFIGKHLLAKAIDQDHTVISLSRPYTWVRDLDVVFHLAAAPHENMIRQLSFEGNVRETVKLLELYPSAHMVFAGTSCEHFATTPHALTKKICSDIVTYHGGTSLRIFSTYGEGARGRLIPNVVAAGLRGEHAQYAEGSLSHDFIHVDDICDAFIEAAHARVPGCYDAGTGLSTSLFEVAQIAARVFELDGEPTFGSHQARSWDSEAWPSADVHKTARALGWRAKISLEEGMRRMAGR